MPTVETVLKHWRRCRRLVRQFANLLGIREIVVQTSAEYPVAKWASKNGFVEEPRQTFKYRVTPLVEPGVGGPTCVVTLMPQKRPISSLRRHDEHAQADYKTAFANNQSFWGNLTTTLNNGCCQASSSHRHRWLHCVLRRWTLFHLSSVRPKPAAGAAAARYGGDVASGVQGGVMGNLAGEEAGVESNQQNQITGADAELKQVLTIGREFQVAERRGSVQPNRICRVLPQVQVPLPQVQPTLSPQKNNSHGITHLVWWVESLV